MSFTSLIRSNRALFLALIALAVALLATISHLYGLFDVRLVLSQARDSWLFSPLFYLVAAALVPLVLFPLAPVGILAGALFSPGTAYVVVYASSVLGALFAYYIGSLLRGSSLGALLTKAPYASVVFDELQDRGFETVLLVRLCPVIPYAFINYLAGLAAMSRSSYFGATAIGLLASTALHVYEGTLIRGAAEEGVGNRLWLIKLGLLALGLLAIARIGRHLRTRFRSRAGAAGPA